MKTGCVFDFDGTFAHSEASLAREMTASLGTLLQRVKVTVISGGDWPQFEKQLFANPFADTSPTNSPLLPTCGTKFHRFASSWKKCDSEDIASDQNTRINRSYEKSLELAVLVIAPSQSHIEFATTPKVIHDP
jgi:phosphomannomutase